MTSPRPVIGIPTQTLHVIDDIPPGLPPSWVMNQRYYLAVAAAGAVPWMIPLLHEDPGTLREIYHRLDGVMLAGGVDMDPATYGAVRHPATGVNDPARDAVELQLARWAAEEGKPLLGVCRGLQVINVARGGSLIQDIGSERPDSLKHDYYPTAGFARDYPAHPVRMESGSRLERILGREPVMVNSMHHQAAHRLGENLGVTAVAPDGLVEGLEGTNGGYLVAVQWHPEVFEDRFAPLFRDFVRAAGSGGP